VNGEGEVVALADTEALAVAEATPDEALETALDATDAAEEATEATLETMLARAEDAA
jgi:hypothetical protein